MTDPHRPITYSTTPPADGAGLDAVDDGTLVGSGRIETATHTELRPGYLENAELSCPYLNFSEAEKERVRAFCREHRHIGASAQVRSWSANPIDGVEVVCDRCGERREIADWNADWNGY